MFSAERNQLLKRLLNVNLAAGCYDLFCDLSFMIASRFDSLFSTETFAVSRFKN